MKVFHDHNISFREFIGKFYRYGYSNAKNMKMLNINTYNDGVYSVNLDINFFELIFIILKSAYKRILFNSQKHKLVNILFYLPISLFQEIAYQYGVYRFKQKIK